MMLPLGPHGVQTAPNGIDWARQAPVVKSLDNLDYLAAAPASATQVFRHYWPNQNLDDPIGAARDILAALGGYRSPNLYVEVWNEAFPTLDQLTRATNYLQSHGLEVAGGSYATGTYNASHFELVRSAGCDAIAVHCYWDPGVIDIWEAYRFSLYWDARFPPVIVTECGRRQGNHDVQELATYARGLSSYLYCKGGTVFANRPYPPNLAFDTEPLVPSLLPLLRPLSPPRGAKMLFGVDVSSNNGRVPLSAIAKTCDFVWIKADEGLTYTNPNFKDQWQQAGDIGIPRGAYHFARPSQGSGHDEADHFLNTVTDLRSGDFFALDSEDTLVAANADLVAHHLDFFHTADPVWGAKGLLYTGAWYAGSHNLENSPELATHGLWIADPNHPSAPVIFPQWTLWAFHQYGQGYMPGVLGLTDFNVFNGTAAQLRLYGRP